MTQTAGEIVRRIIKQDQLADIRKGRDPFEDPDDLEGSLIEARCSECRKAFTFEYFMFAHCRQHCDECENERRQKREREEREREEANRRYEWERLCPNLFQHTDRALLPDPSKYDEVLAWQYNPIGLTIHGSTGRGKTRAAYDLTGKHFLAGRGVKIFNSMGGIEFAARYARSTDSAEDYTHELARTGLLFLDDPFKVKLTESTEAMLFAVLNERFERMLPIIATMNDTPSTLAERMTEDRGIPLIRRLKEFTKPIRF